MFLALLLCWIVFNGRFTWEIFFVGLAVSAALTFMWCKIFDIKHDIFIPSPRTCWRYCRYFAGLIVELVRCNIKVMRLILHPQEEIRPQLVTFRTDLKQDNHRVILANSITLTPGTITVGMKDNILRVHGLDASFLEGIEDCDMVRRLRKMEEGTTHE